MFNKSNKSVNADINQNLINLKTSKKKNVSDEEVDTSYMSHGINYLYERMEEYMSEEVELSDHMNRISGLTYETGNRIDSIYLNLEKSNKRIKDYSDCKEDIDASIDNVNRSLKRTGKNISNLSESLLESQNDMLNIQKTFTKLESDFRNINRYIKNINAIAHTTNLLSLNASVEASKAGERGSGFMVVADHINKLSETTKQISKGIESSIEQIHISMERLQLEIDEASANFENNILNHEGVKSSYREMVSKGEETKTSLDNFENIINKTKSNQDVLNESLTRVSRGIGEIDSEVINLTEKNSEKSISLGEMVDILIQFQNIFNEDDN